MSAKDAAAIVAQVSDPVKPQRPQWVYSVEQLDV
jgi:hypothetical protein